MSIKQLLVNSGFLVMLVIGTADLQAKQSAVQTGTDTVRVSGLVLHALGVSLPDANGLSLKPTPSHQMRNTKGELKKTFPVSKAYLLKDIIEKADPVIGEHKEQGKFVIVVTANDGYTVVFSYAELMYGAASETTWLMPVSSFEALRADGPFVLLSMSDRVSAPRYVKWVKSIEVRKI